MKRISSLEDDMRDVVTYELPGGRRVCLEGRAVREIGAAELLRRHGYETPTERVAVFWDGRRVGTVAPDFDPTIIRSTTFLYEPRSGDFIRGDDGWTADRMLGPGDLEAVPSFVWDLGVK